MKVTQDTVEESAKQRGLEPVQVHGIPEGFSFKEPDLTIDSNTYEGHYVAFVPLREWDDERHLVRALSIPALQTLFKRNNV